MIGIQHDPKKKAPFITGTTTDGHTVVIATADVVSLEGHSAGTHIRMSSGVRYSVKTPISDLVGLLGLELPA